MTLGFNKRHELKRELRKAFDEGKNIYFFKKDDLDYSDLVIELGQGEKIGPASRNKNCSWRNRENTTGS